MRISLQVRVLLLVAAVNLVLFGAGLVFLTFRLADERQALTDELAERLAEALGPTIRTGGEIHVAQLLRWPSWSSFEDAVILGAPWDLTTSGEVVPRGAFLNPVGRVRRPSTFDEPALLALIRDAVRSAQAIPGQGGVALPIVDARGAVWGGCWFALPQAIGAGGLLLRLLPWFLVSTLLLTLGTFSVLRRFVLDPVQELAEGARRVSRGDFAVRLAVPLRRDELADLIRGFNEMTRTAHEYNERLAREVEIATEQVRRAEGAAMTQRRLAATGELAAGVAHEINNPLGGLLNAAEALARGDLPPEKRAQYHDLLRSGLERIRATVGQLLRLTPRARRTRPAPVQLLAPVEDAIALVQHRARAQGIAIELRADGARGASDEEVRRRLAALPAANGEAGEIGQAVLNLLVNSLDALEGRRGRIEVELGRTDGELWIAVRDDGPGVEAAELAKVADLFYTTKEPGKGSGLGLAVVHSVAAACGGRVELASEPGAGFSATIYLPVFAAPRREEP